MTEQEFKQELEQLGIILTAQQEKQFLKYYDLLIEWNQKINLTGITDKNMVYLKHFYDSATLIKAIDLKKESTLCDIGTGAGFPGIVLKILFPDLKVVLIDSLEKRIHFLNIVIEQLQLGNITALHERAEIYAQKHRESFDIVTARAVSNLSNLMEICIPLVKKGKYFIPMKSDISQEIQGISNALKVLEVTIESTIDFYLPKEKSYRTLLKIKKNQLTNQKYPRHYSEIKKRPL